MPIPGRQEQTLVYRVELDESSVAQIIRTARESVGVGLQQASSMGTNVITQGQLTASTAIAQVGSHLEFLERTRSALGAPATMMDTAAGMGIARALGVRAGIVTPGFNEMGSSLQRRADAALGGPYSTAGLTFASGAASAGMMVGGLALAFMGPQGLVAGGALMAAELGLDAGITAGFDRAIGRTRMAGHLRRFGVDRSYEIARQFERDASGIRGSYGELSDIALGTLSNVRFQPGDDVNSALMGAIGDYRLAGKLLGMGKEQAFGTVMEMYRAGVTPGSAGEHFARVGALSNMMGYDPSAVHARALDVARGAAGQGYDTFGAMNTFMIQSSMVAQAVRSGTMDRGMLTAAAGFAGPEGEQVLGAAQQLISQTMQFQQTGLGRGLVAGIMAGGRGSTANLLSAAGGMSATDILSFDVNSMNMGLTGQAQGALTNLAVEALRNSGAQVNQATLQGALMNLGGYTTGVAGMAAQQYFNPGNRGVALYGAQLAEMQARAESMGPSSGLSRTASLFGSRIGTGIDYYMRESDIGLDADDLTLIDNPDRPYRGLAGVGDRWANVYRVGVGEMFTDIGEGWESMWAGATARLGYRTQTGMRGRSLGSVMSRQRVEAMNPSSLRETLRTRRRLMVGYGSKESRGGTSFAGYLRNEEMRVLGRALDVDGGRRGMFLEDRTAFITRTGIDLNEDTYAGLVTQTERYRRMAQGAGTLEERAAVMDEYRGYLQASGTGIDRGSIDVAAEFLMNETTFAFTTAESNRLVDITDIQAYEGMMSSALGSKERREAIASTYFKSGSKAEQALLGADKMGLPGFKNLVAQAVARGDIRSSASGRIRSLTGGGVGVSSAIVKDVLISASETLALKAGADDPGSPAGDEERAPMNGLVPALTDLNKNLLSLIEKLD
jgi:hypothetical protein